jgi:hypothetical protein
MGHHVTTIETRSIHRRKTIDRHGLSLTFFLLLLYCTSARAQVEEQTVGTTTFTVSTSLGFNTFALGDVRDFYSGLLEEFRANNIPIPTQREFPGNLIIGVDILYSIPSIADVGLGSRYTWTRAFSLYRDYSGTLDVNGKVAMLSLEGIIQRDITTEGIVDVYAGLRGGLVLGWSKFSQKSVFYDFPDQNSEILLSGNGKGYSVEGFMGIKRRVGNIAFGVSAGYRYARVSEMDADFSLNGQTQDSGTLLLRHDLSGFTMCVHVDIVLE